jgi:hypothetical protein
MMGTFIITFIGNSVVDRGSTDSGPLRMLPFPARRRAIAFVYFGAILAVFVTLGVVTIPDVSTEGVHLVRRLQSDTLWVVLVEKMRAGLGDQLMGSLEKMVYLATSNDITKVNRRCAVLCCFALRCSALRCAVLRCAVLCCSRCSAL